MIWNLIIIRFCSRDRDFFCRCCERSWDFDISNRIVFKVCVIVIFVELGYGKCWEWVWSGEGSWWIRWLCNGVVGFFVLCVYGWL